MTSAIALRHLAFEDLGSLQPVLERAGYAVSYIDVGVDAIDRAESADLLIVLGGPIAAYDGEYYPILPTNSLSSRSGSPREGHCWASASAPS